MPVHVLTYAAGQAVFIVCDRRSDVTRVPVPVGQLEQWQTSGASIANLIARLLGLRRSGADNPDTARWDVGLFKGRKHSSHLVLSVDGTLKLGLAGHSIELSDLLVLKDETFEVDQRTLTRLVDQPITGGGDTESAAQRRERLRKRVRAVQAAGVKGFVKQVAAEEDISITRLKQLLKDEPARKKP